MRKKAPGFAVGYVMASRGTKAEEKSKKSTPIEDPVMRGRTWF